MKNSRWFFMYQNFYPLPPFSSLGNTTRLWYRNTFGKHYTKEDSLIGKGHLLLEYVVHHFRVSKKWVATRDIKFELVDFLFFFLSMIIKKKRLKLNSKLQLFCAYVTGSSHETNLFFCITSFSNINNFQKWEPTK